MEQLWATARIGPVAKGLIRSLELSPTLQPQGRREGRGLEILLVTEASGLVCHAHVMAPPKTPYLMGLGEPPDWQTHSHAAPQTLSDPIYLPVYVDVHLCPL